MDLRQVSFEVIDDGCLVVRRRSNRGPFPGVRPGIPCSVHPVVTLVCSFGLALKGELSGQLPTVSALAPECDIGLASNLGPRSSAPGPSGTCGICSTMVLIDEADPLSRLFERSQSDPRTGKRPASVDERGGDPIRAL